MTNGLEAKHDDGSESDISSIFSSVSGEFDDGACLEYDDSAALEPVDYTKPLKIGNIAVISKELMSENGDGEFLRQLQHSLQEAVIKKNSDRCTSLIQKLKATGRARNFLAVVGLLNTGLSSGFVANRRYDHDFDGELLTEIMEFTKIPSSVLNPQALMRASLSMSDPLLLVTSLDAGACVDDCPSSISALKHATVRAKSFMIDALERAALPERAVSLHATAP